MKKLKLQQETQLKLNKFKHILKLKENLPTISAEEMVLIAASELYSLLRKYKFPKKYHMVFKFREQFPDGISIDFVEYDPIRKFYLSDNEYISIFNYIERNHFSLQELVSLEDKEVPGFHDKYSNEFISNINKIDSFFYIYPYSTDQKSVFLVSFLPNQEIKIIDLLKEKKTHFKSEHIEGTYFPAIPERNLREQIEFRTWFSTFFMYDADMTELRKKIVKSSIHELDEVSQEEFDFIEYWTNEVFVKRNIPKEI